jgi:hypothetical protein
MTLPEFITLECLYRSSPSFAWIPAKNMSGMTDSNRPTSRMTQQAGEIHGKEIELQRAAAPLP